MRNERISIRLLNLPRRVVLCVELNLRSPLFHRKRHRVFFWHIVNRNDSIAQFRLGNPLFQGRREEAMTTEEKIEEIGTHKCIRA